jgi:hypothetical protein
MTGREPSRGGKKACKNIHEGGEEETHQGGNARPEYAERKRRNRLGSLAEKNNKRI